MAHTDSVSVNEHNFCPLHCQLTHSNCVQAVTHMGLKMEQGLLNLDDLLNSAISDDAESIKSLLGGFISDKEEILDCGYLGTLGYFFPEHSFWCISSDRLCSLRIKKGGEMSFNSAYLEYINSSAFYQPSLIKLLILIILTIVTTFGLGILAIPFVIRTYYLTNKSGAVFWVNEGIPIYIYSDRSYLKRAQRISILTLDYRKNKKL